MKRCKITLLAPLIFLCLGICFAQTKPSPNKHPSETGFVRSSAAYTEVLLKTTELEADLEDLLVAYTLEFPKVKEVQFQIKLLNIETEKLFNTRIEEREKLTSALGKLIVRKVELEGELWLLKEQYGADHPNVKKAIRKVLVYESAIKEVLF